MNSPATFVSVFSEICKAKLPVGASDASLENNPGGDVLLNIRGDSSVFSFTMAGLSFVDDKKQAISYSWDDLDIILPTDLSLIGDKLNSFTDLGSFSAFVSIWIGYAVTAVASAYPAYRLVVWEYDFIAQTMDSLNAWPPWLFLITLIVGVVILLVLVVFAVAVDIAGLGLLGSVAALLGMVLMPVVSLCLPKRFKMFHNTIIVIGHRWMKDPWGTSTSTIRDLVVVGVKLRRRGLAS